MKETGITGWLRSREIGLISRTKNCAIVKEIGDRCSSKPDKYIALQDKTSIRSTFLCDFSPDGTLIASAHGDHHVRVCRVHDGKCTHELKGHRRTPWCLQFHPSNPHLLASGCLGGEVRIWDLLGGGSEIYCGLTSPVSSLSFHPLDNVLVFAIGPELFFWDWAKPEPFASVKTAEPEQKIKWVKYDSTGMHLYTAIINNSSRSSDFRPANAHAGNSEGNRLLGIPRRRLDHDSLQYVEPDRQTFPSFSLESLGSDQLDVSNDAVPSLQTFASRHVPRSSEAPLNLSTRDSLSATATNHAPYTLPCSASVTSYLNTSNTSTVRGSISPRSSTRSELSAEDLFNDVRFPVDRPSDRTSDGPVRWNELWDDRRLNRAPERMSDRWSDRPLNHASERMSDRWSGRPLNHASERMYDRRNDRLLHHASERMFDRRNERTLNRAFGRMSDRWNERVSNDDQVNWWTNRRSLGSTDRMDDANAHRQSNPFRSIWSTFMSSTSSPLADSATFRNRQPPDPLSPLRVSTASLADSAALQNRQPPGPLSPLRVSTGSHNSEGQNTSFRDHIEMMERMSVDSDQTHRPRSRVLPSGSTRTQYLPDDIRARLHEFNDRFQEFENRLSDVSPARPPASDHEYGPRTNPYVQAQMLRRRQFAGSQHRQANFDRSENTSDILRQTSNTADQISILARTLRVAHSSDAISQEDRLLVASESEAGSSGVTHNRSERIRNWLRVGSTTDRSQGNWRSATNTNSSSSNPHGISLVPNMALMDHTERYQPGRTENESNVERLSSTRQAPIDHSDYTASAAAQAPRISPRRTDILASAARHQDSQVLMPTLLGDTERMLRDTERMAQQNRSSAETLALRRLRASRFQMDNRVENRDNQRSESDHAPIRSRLQLIPRIRSPERSLHATPPSVSAVHSNAVADVQRAILDLQRARRYHEDTSQQNQPSESNTAGDGYGYRRRRRHLFNNDLRGANNEINRVLAGVFFGRGDPAVGTNLSPTSFRIQRWNVSKNPIPDISNHKKNIVVPKCKIHNDASLHISADGKRLAVLYQQQPEEHQLIEDTLLGIYSLEKSTLGVQEYAHTFGPNAISVRFSPSGRYVVVGLASRRLTILNQSATQPIGQVFDLQPSRKNNMIIMKEDIYHHEEEEAQNTRWRHLSINIISWLPHSGQGLVYGTNMGHLVHCKPRLNMKESSVTSELNDCLLRQMLEYRNNNGRNSTRRSRPIVNSGTQTVTERYSSRATQTDPVQRTTESSSEASSSQPAPLLITQPQIPQHTNQSPTQHIALALTPQCTTQSSTSQRTTLAPESQRSTLAPIPVRTSQSGTPCIISDPQLLRSQNIPDLITTGFRSESAGSNSRLKRSSSTSESHHQRKLNRPTLQQAGEQPSSLEHSVHNEQLTLVIPGSSGGTTSPTAREELNDREVSPLAIISPSVYPVQPPPRDANSSDSE